MNRDILFRGKRVDNGEWIYGYLAGYDLIAPDEPESTENATGAYYGDTPYVGFVEVNPNTVGQYTGLTDANGVKIFENDILFDEFGENYCVVKFGEYSSPMGSDRYTANVGFYTAWIGKRKELLRQDLGYWIKSMKDTTRVVGNIHDNPDMLTDKGEG